MRLRPEYLLLLLLGCGIAGAQEGDGTAPAAAASAPTEPAGLRPNGPVTVTADRGEWVQGGPMRYTGNVALRSETLSLDGDALELKQLGDGRFEARISGKPAHLRQAGSAATATSKAVAPVIAEANELFYDSQAGVVQLTGNAHLLRGGDEISSDTIRYDVNARRVQAEGGGNGQVRIIIQPPQAAKPATAEPRKP